MAHQKINVQLKQQQRSSFNLSGKKNLHIPERALDATTPRIAKHGILEKMRRVHARAMSARPIAATCVMHSAAAVGRRAVRTGSKMGRR